MPLADQMRPLVHRLAAAHRERVAGTREMLTGLQLRRRAMAAAQHRRLGEDRDELSASARTFLADAATVRSAKAANERQFRMAYQAERRSLAREQRTDLAAFVAELRTDVTLLIRVFAETRQDMADEQRERLAAFVEELQTDTAAFVADMGPARQEMADEQRERLATERLRLAAKVSKLRRALQDDSGEASRLWRSLGALKRGRRAQPAPRARPAPRAVPAVRDDLTQVKGLGPATERRLNDAGIVSLAQLATSSPDEIRQALGNAGARANVNDWIKEARTFAGV